MPIRIRKHMSGAALVAAALAALVSARADFRPVLLTPGSYTFDIVVESNAPAALPYCITATSGLGTSLGDNTFYEQGLYARPGQTGGNSGIPPHNSVFTARNNAGIQFLLPPDYTTNNDLLIDSGNPAGTLTFTTPVVATNLAFLCTDGSGAMSVNYTVNHVDGSTDTGSLSLLDWFTGGSTIAWGANGRITSGGTYNNYNSSSVNNNAPYLYCNNITVAGGSAISNIVFTYASGTSHANFYAVSANSSGSTWTPVPVSGFNQATTVPATFPLTATMDQGTNTVNNGNLATWFEQGFIRGSPTYGLPPSGSTFQSISNAGHFFQMGNYSANNAILIDLNHAVANITPANPTPYTAFALLTAGGNIGSGKNNTNLCIMQYLDGTTETNLFLGYDWFEGSRGAYEAWHSGGRVNMYSRTVNNVGTVNPKLFETYFFLGNTASPVTNIVLRYKTVTGSSATTFVLAVSATAGGVAPTLAAGPQPLNTPQGSNAQFTVSLATGTQILHYQWQIGTNGTFVNLADGGRISGSKTSTLSLSDAQLSDTASYQVIITNSAGAVTSSPALLVVYSSTPGLTMPGDSISVFAGADAPANGVSDVIDHTTTAWINYGVNGTAPFAGPVGLVVTPSRGASIATGVRFYPGPDATDNDPVDFTLEGSNDGGATFTPITTSSLWLPNDRNPAGLALDPATEVLREIALANSASYTSYRLTFHNVRNAATAAGLELGEAELIGSYAPSFTAQPVASVTRYAGGTATLSSAATGSPAPGYQWYVNGATPLSGQTNSTLVLTNLALGQSGNVYTCVASNYIGTATTTGTLLTVLPNSFAGYAAAVVTDHPVAFWRLNEANVDPINNPGNNGAVANDYVGGYSGTYSNVSLELPGFNPAVNPDTAAGFGSAATNNNPGFATDSFVDNIPLDFGAVSNAQFSIECWIQGGPQTTDCGVLARGTGAGGEQFDLDFGGNNHALRFFWRNAAGGIPAALNTTFIPDGAWHHLAATVDQVNHYEALYVDGLAVATSTNLTGADGLLATTHPLTIGARQSGSATYDFQFNGLISEVAAYRTALSSNQVLAHFYAAELAPLIIQAPTNTTVAEGTKATFAVKAYGTPPLAFQWYDSTLSPSVLLPGATNATLVLSNVSAAAYNGHYYQVVVTNIGGATTSPSPGVAPGALLTVVSGPPVPVVDLPAQAAVYADGTISLSVTWGGTAPFTNQWQVNGVNLVEGGRFTGTRSNVLTITDAQLSDAATYQLVAVNAAGSGSSTPCALIVNKVPLFNGSGLGWTANGNKAGLPAISSDVLAPTDGGGGEASSFFYNTPVYIGNFVASFTYQDNTAGGADGVAFVLQNDPAGVSALGDTGGGLGYARIVNSVALLLDIYTGNSQGGSGIAIGTNGITPGDPGTIPGLTYTSASPVFLTDGNPVDVTLAYAAGVANLTLQERTSTATNIFTASLPIGDLRYYLGTNTAYVGFTGGSGAVDSAQQISNFSFLNYPVLNVANGGAGTVVLTWPAGVGGYVLQQNSVLDGTAAWTDVPTVPNLVAGQNQVVLTPATRLFFRLKLTLP